MLYQLVVWVTKVWGRLFYGLEYDGLENIPDGGGFIVVSNHRSYWDPFFIGLSLMPRRLAIMAKKELFKNKLVGRFVSHFGAFPVDRGAGDMGAVDYAVQAVKEGRVLVIFPEGTRSREPEMLRFKSGAAHIIAQAGVNVLPVAIDFKGRIHPGGKVRIHIGKVLTCGELGLDGEYSLGAVRRATKVLRESVDSMLVLCR